MMKVSRHSSDHFQLSEKCDHIDLVNINVYAKFYGNISNGLEVGPVSLFQNLDLGKASTNDKMSFGNPLGYILSISMYAKYYAQFKIKSQFHFSRILTSVKARPMRNDIWQYLGLQFVNTNVCVKNKNIPHGPRDRASITFSEFGLCNASTKDKWHLAISWARSCQYKCICIISSTYSTWFKRQDQFYFF